MRDVDAPQRSTRDRGAGATVVIADRYELRERIAQGRCGSVYRAHDRTLTRDVALKLLLPGAPVFAEREAQLLARVSHRNVVTIHDSGTSDGQRYLVLELLDGPDLGRWLAEPRSSAEILEHFLAAGRGLAAAHRAGLVHCDFKPKDVMVTREGRVVVIELAVAPTLHQSGRALDRERLTRGTLAYMAPERLAGHEHDARSDQFSFCVALWQALSGRAPFVGDDPLARYSSIRRGSPSGEPRVCAHLRAALRRGMSFDASERFASLDELLRELSRPAPKRARPRRPWLTAAAIAGTFLLGWGVAPESPTLEEVHSQLDLPAELAMSLLESSRRRALDGDGLAAIEDLTRAQQVVEQALRPGSASYCEFGTAVPEVADALMSSGSPGEARIAYAIAVFYGRNCELPVSDLLDRQRSARELDLWQHEHGSR